MGNSPFIGQDLIKVHPVGFEYVLPQTEPVQDRTDRIDTVNGEEKQPDRRVVFDHQLKQQGNNPK